MCKNFDDGNHHKDPVLLEERIAKLDLAREGNGADEELSWDQLGLIQDLYERLLPLAQRGGLQERPHDKGFFDHETCRRYLVARSWNLQKAYDQLLSTVEWRIESDPAAKQFWQSSKCLQNPFALSMRVIGFGKDGQPIAYTCFKEAHDRFEVPKNMEHMELLLESCCSLIRQRRKLGLNQTASSRQCVWVVDFDGFGFRDQDPRSAVETAKLLQHHPEMLYMIVLIDPPMLFQGLWKLVSPLLDTRVRNKILFIKGTTTAAELLHERLGNEAAEWLMGETLDNKEKQAEAKKKNGGQQPKRYWITPTTPDQHDARGMASYVHSDFYVKTPGDAYEELRRQKQNTIQQHHQDHNTIATAAPAVEPRIVKSLYSGNF